MTSPLICLLFVESGDIAFSQPQSWISLSCFLHKRDCKARCVSCVGDPAVTLRACRSSCTWWDGRGGLESSYSVEALKEYIESHARVSTFVENF